LLILFDDDNKADLFLKDVGRIIPDFIPRILVRTKCENMSKQKNYEQLSKSVKLDTSEFNQIPCISVKHKKMSELIESLYTIIEKPYFICRTY